MTFFSVFKKCVKFLEFICIVLTSIFEKQNFLFWERSFMTFMTPIIIDLSDVFIHLGIDKTLQKFPIPSLQYKKGFRQK